MGENEHKRITRMFKEMGLQVEVLGEDCYPTCDPLEDKGKKSFTFFRSTGSTQVHEGKEDAELA